MSAQNITIQFKNVVQLWNYVQVIECRNIEIIAADNILICECSENDIAMLPFYEGFIIEDYNPLRKLTISNNK